jgi:HEPN domain-containing protein
MTKSKGPVSEYVKRWLIKANNDLKVAENEIKLPQEDMVTEAICFHSQQAVEKFLKAYLITKKVEFGKTHNLEFLLELCSKKDKEFGEINVGNLSFYSVEVRYPNEFHIPSREEAKSCLSKARGVKEVVLKKLNVEESELNI